MATCIEILDFPKENAKEMIKLKAELADKNAEIAKLVDMPVKPRQDGFTEPRGIPLSDIDENTLLEMCEEFTKAVIAKA